MPQAPTPLADIGTYDFDLRTGVLVWSEQLYQICGVDPDGAVLTVETAQELCHPADRPLLAKATADILQNGLCDFEYRTVRPDGEARTLFVRGALMRDARGEPARIAGFVVDVTSRRVDEAEATRKASEELFFKAFDNSPVALAIRDVESGALVQINAAYTRLTGYSREEVLGNELAETPWAVNPREVMEAAQRFLRQGRVQAVQTQLRRKSGEIRTVDMGAEMTTVNGRTCALITLIDQTPRVEAEARLTESEERFRRLADAAWEGIALSDQGIMVDTNAQLAKILGYETHELIGKPVFDLVAPGSLETVRDHIRSGSTEPYEHNALRKDGSIVTVEARGETVPYKGRTIRMTAIRDISDRKQAEARRRALIAGTATAFGVDFFRSLVRHLASAFNVKCALVLELVAPDQRRVRAVHAWADGGYMAPFEFDLDGTPTSHVLAHGMVHFRDDIAKAFPRDEILADLGVVGYLGAPLLDAAQRPLGVLAVLHDRPLELTEAQVFMLTIFAARAGAELERTRAEEQVRQVEAQLRQSQKLEAVGQLAGGVAHDFNNLLTVINGYCERLLAGPVRETEIRGDIDLIHKAGQRAAALTSQLLAFSRRQVLQPKLIELNSVVVDMNKMLQRVLGEHITTITSLDPSLGATRADPGQLGQVVMNLAINARDAMPDGGTLTIETANVTVRADQPSSFGLPPGDYVSLVVRDTGHGINEEMVSHIFEPFFTTKDVGKGSGLGLPTVYGIVKQSGGEIAVESTPNVGTTMRVFLPRVESAPSTDTGPAAVSAVPRGHETILLVEDEDLVRDLVRDLLEEGGYRVLEAQDGEEALRIVRAAMQPIQLVVTDVVLPGMNGTDLVKQLQTVVPALRALFVSGYPGDAVFQHGAFEPGPAFLAKPFTRDVLIQKVREVLDRPVAAGTVLVVEDDPDIRQLVTGFLRKAGYVVFDRWNDVPDGDASRRRGHVDVVLFDLDANSSVGDIDALARQLPGARFVVTAAAFDDRLSDHTKNPRITATLQKPLNGQSVLEAVAKARAGGAGRAD